MVLMSSPGPHVEEVDGGAALGVAAQVGQREDALLVDLAGIGEAQKEVVRVRHEQVLDEVAYLGLRALDALAAALLLAVGAELGALDVALVR